MPRCCSVVGCKSNYKSEGVFVSTFALPKDEDLKRKWIQSIPTDLSRLKNPIICLKHFDPCDVNWIDKCTVKGEVKEYFRKIPKLKVGALPCIFSNVPDELSASLKVKEENEMHFSENCDSEEWFEESKTVIVPNDYWNVESMEVQNEQQEETGQSAECIIPKKEKIESNEEEEAETCPPFCLVLVEEEPFEIEDTAESDVFEPEGHLCPELPKEGEGVVHPNEGASLLTKRRQTVPGKKANKMVSAHENANSDHKLRWPCSGCEKDFSEQYQLDDHVKTHFGRQPLKSPVSQRASMIDRTLGARVFNKRPREKIYQCRVCKEKFQKLTLLQSHMVQHENAMPYQCVICHKGFLSQSKLQDHIWTHPGVCLFECTVCHKRYRSAAILKIHMLSHSWGQCYKVLGRGEDLRARGKMRPGGKMHRCKMCGKDFAGPQNLKKHMVLHVVDV